MSPLVSCQQFDSFYWLILPATDPVKLGIPHYPKIVKKPMDLSTMRKKLDSGEYPNANKFKEDFALMIRNCMAFNPAGTVVHDAGVELQRAFEEKWAHLPPLKQPSDDEEEEDEEDTDDERMRKHFRESCDVCDTDIYA